MAPQKLNHIYADEMQNHPYGYALYQPVFSSVIKPGVVGYFDPAGFWSPLADLTDEASLKSAGLKPPKHLSPAPSQKQTWGPMTSKSVSGHNLDISGGKDPALTGLPLSASLQFKYTTSSTFGALLVTTPPITHSAFYYSSPFFAWVSDNAQALLSGEHKDDIHANGLVVVTQTYDTSKCSLTAWTDSKSEVFLGFDAGVTGVGDLKAQGGWYEGNSASGWQKYEGEGDETVVVFVGGLWYDCQKDGFGNLLRKDKFDGESSGNVGGQDSGENHTVHVTTHPGEKYTLRSNRWGQPLAED